MNAIALLFIGLGAFGPGYVVYSRFIASRIYALDDSRPTPAHEFEDGVDFVPTNRFILWGHHFISTAGAAPIVGPAIAVIWGWLPAFMWVVLGTVFFAGYTKCALGQRPEQGPGGRCGSHWRPSC